MYPENVLPTDQFYEGGVTLVTEPALKTEFGTETIATSDVFPGRTPYRMQVEALRGVSERVIQGRKLAVAEMSKVYLTVWLEGGPGVHEGDLVVVRGLVVGGRLDNGSWWAWADAIAKVKVDA